ncbi:hypothetical protein B0J13DRAFT_565419, partial [Dactylonectria estremocensis]
SPPPPSNPGPSCPSCDCDLQSSLAPVQCVSAATRHPSQQLPFCGAGEALPHCDQPPLPQQSHVSLDDSFLPLLGSLWAWGAVAVWQFETRRRPKPDALYSCTCLREHRKMEQRYRIEPHFEFRSAPPQSRRHVPRACLSGLFGRPGLVVECDFHRLHALMMTGPSCHWRRGLLAWIKRHGDMPISGERETNETLIERRRKKGNDEKNEEGESLCEWVCSGSILSWVVRLMCVESRMQPVCEHEEAAETRRIPHIP